MVFVWALRNKGSEWRSVESFLRLGKLPFTPLVEAVCEPFIPDRDGRVKQPVAEMRRLAGRLLPMSDSGRVWLDLGHLVQVFSARDVARLLGVVRGELGLFGAAVAPVVRTSSPGEIVEAAIMWAREMRSGLCIRVDGLTHLREKATTVSEIVSGSKLADSDVDLVLDAADLPRAVSHEEQRQTFPLSESARTFVALAGTFPRTISNMSPDEYVHFRERDEWLSWLNQVRGYVRGRIPTYGDYATQPAIYTPSQRHPPSPSVRYTTRDRFVVLRGRGGKQIDFSQFVGHARYLRTQPYFRDGYGTVGDSYIEAIASQSRRTGNSTTWRIASFQRHLQVVEAQVAAAVPVVAH